jgi:hypothetical protein
VPSFTEFKASKGPRCQVCRLDDDLLQEVNANEHDARPERTLMVEYLEQEAPGTNWTRDLLYGHRSKCLGLPRSGART